MQMGRLVNYFLGMAAASMAWAVAAFGGAPQASAMEGWSDGRPVFPSESRRQYRSFERFNDRYYDERYEEPRRPQYRRAMPALMQGGPRPEIIPAAPPIVTLDAPEQPGTIIIDTGGRRLFYVLPGDQAYEYPISVGREGFNWHGTETISRIASWPDWHPPAEMRQREPHLPVKMTGGINNPLGARALYLGNTLYRIHGTNDLKSIGEASSSGCFRLANHHVAHLAEIASVGAEVRVVTSYGSTASNATAVLE